MICTRVAMPDGSVAIMCGSRPRRRRCACGAWAPLLCDWKVPARRSGTCDRPICEACASHPAPDKDLCPEHAAAWRSHPRNPICARCGHDQRTVVCMDC